MESVTTDDASVILALQAKHALLLLDVQATVLGMVLAIVGAANARQVLWVEIATLPNLFVKTIVMEMELAFLVLAHAILDGVVVRVLFLQLN